MQPSAERYQTRPMKGISSVVSDLAPVAPGEAQALGHVAHAAQGGAYWGHRLLWRIWPTSVVD